MSKITVRQIDGIINRAELKRHSNQCKEERRGGRGELIKRCIVKFIEHKTAKSPTALVRRADPLIS